jgi:hypothetical protein
MLPRKPISLTIEAVREIAILMKAGGATVTKDTEEWTCCEHEKNDTESESNPDEEELEKSR